MAALLHPRFELSTSHCCHPVDLFAVVDSPQQTAEAFHELDRLEEMT